MKVARFYSDGELSPIRVSNADETVLEVNHLFLREQMDEQRIIALIRQPNELGNNSEADALRLDFKRIYSKKEILVRTRFGRFKFFDSALHSEEFSIQTILAIKGEERYLSARFSNFMVLRSRFRNPAGSEPYLFASLKNGYYYLLNAPEVSASNVFVSVFKKTFTWIQKKISSGTSTK